MTIDGHQRFVTTLTHRRQTQRGTSMAEFGLIVIPSLILIFAVMNFAIALYCYDFVGYSAQQAARYAIVHGATATQTVTAAGMQTYVQGLVNGAIDTTQLTVSTTWSPNNQPGSTVTVTVGYTYKPLSNLVSSANITLS
jgi:Flp pilus assembly protein TadG